MKLPPKKYLIIAGAYVGIALVIILIFALLYSFNDFFRSLIEGNVTPSTQLKTGNDLRKTAETVEAINRNGARLSLVILVFILVLQVFAFMTAAIVFFDLKRSREDIRIRMNKLENADIFLDLPLYFGLLGTVASFIIMSYNPNISRLIAYSSTLVGIIFSVILRLSLQYPLKQTLIAVSAEEKEKDDGK